MFMVARVDAITLMSCLRRISETLAPPGTDRLVPVVRWCVFGGLAWVPRGLPGSGMRAMKTCVSHGGFGLTGACRAIVAVMGDTA